MTDQAPPTPLGDVVAPTRTPLATYAAYKEGVDQLLADAAREILVFDPDCEQLSLDRAGRIDQLQAVLARSQKTRIRIAVHRTEHLTARCPRFMRLMRAWTTRIEVNLTEHAARRAQDCFLVVDHDDCVRRPVARQPSGVLIRADPHEVALQRLRFEEIWASSTPGLAPTTLGLY